MHQNHAIYVIKRLQAHNDKLRDERRLLHETIRRLSTALRIDIQKLMDEMDAQSSL